MRYLNPGSDRLHNGTSNRAENVRNPTSMTGLTFVTFSKCEDSLGNRFQGKFHLKRSRRGRGKRTVQS